MAGRKIVIEFLGDDKSASKTAAGVGKNVNKLGGGFARLNKLAAGGLLAAGATAFKIGESFSEMRNTIVVGTGASGEALSGLERVAKDIGKTTPSSFGDVGTAVADLNTRLGLTGKPLEDMSSRFLNLSRVTKSDLSSNIANASRVFGDWNITAKQQPAALDAIFEATKRTGIGLDQLTNNVVQFGAPLRQFGYSFEESLALFGKWEKEGVNTEVVLAGLKAGLGKFSKEGKEPVKALEDIQEAIKGAGSAGEANQIAIEAFGQRAGPDMAAAVREGRFELGDMADQLKKSGGAIEDADKRTRTFKDSLQLMKNRVMVPLEPVAVKLFNSIGEGAEFAAGFVEQHGTIVGIAAAALGAMAGAIVTVNLATKVWSATLAMNPIGLVVIGLAGLAAGLVVAYKKSETFRKIVDGAMAKVKIGVKALGEVFRWLWNSVVQPVTRFIVQAFGTLLKTWGKLVSALGNVPGFGWAKEAGKKMEDAGVKALQLADGIKKIPSKKSIDISSNALAVARNINALNAATRASGGTVRYTSGYGGGRSFAKGTNYSPRGPARVWEEGGEIMNLPSGTQIIPHDISMAMAQRSGGGGTAVDQRPIVVQLMLDGKAVHQVLLKRKRDGGIDLGLA